MHLKGLFISDFNVDFYYPLQQNIPHSKLSNETYPVVCIE